MSSEDPSGAKVNRRIDYLQDYEAQKDRERDSLPRAAFGCLIMLGILALIAWGAIVGVSHLMTRESTPPDVPFTPGVTSPLDPTPSDHGPLTDQQEENLRIGVQACLSGNLPTNVDPQTGRDFCAAVKRVNGDLSQLGLG